MTTEIDKILKEKEESNGSKEFPQNKLQEEIYYFWKIRGWEEVRAVLGNLNISFHQKEKYTSLGLDYIYLEQFYKQAIKEGFEQCQQILNQSLANQQDEMIKEEIGFLERQNKEFDFQFLSKSNNLRWMNNRRIDELKQKLTNHSQQDTRNNTYTSPTVPQSNIEPLEVGCDGKDCPLADSPQGKGSEQEAGSPRILSGNKSSTHVDNPIPVDSNLNKEIKEGFSEKESGK